MEKNCLGPLPTGTRELEWTWLQMVFGAREGREPFLIFGFSTHMPPLTDSHRYQQHTRSMNRRKNASTFNAFAMLRTVLLPLWFSPLLVVWLKRLQLFINVWPPCWPRSGIGPTAPQWIGYDAPCLIRYSDLPFFVFEVIVRPMAML